MDDFKALLDSYCNTATPANLDRATAKATSKTADIYLFGVIGGETANLDKFKRDLDAAKKAETINVYINTVGGAFNDGLPIYNLLEQHPAKITVKIMGYCLSIGSVIMLAADRIECAANGMIMIHRAQGFTYGDASDHAKTATVLQKHEAAIIPHYASKLHKTPNEVQALLNAETWYTATEAKAAGLIDAIIGSVDPDTASDGAGMTGSGRDVINAYKCKPGTLCLPQSGQGRGHYS